MTRFYLVLLLILILPNLSMATPLFEVDDEFPESTRKRKGLTVEVPVSRYYPTDTQSALYKVLKQAQILTANVSFMGRDGVPYEQHDWKNDSDQANLKVGIDCSRAIWFAFTRAGVSYNPQNDYLTTSEMWRQNSNMSHYFRSCSINDLRLGDVLVYRGGGQGHTVMVLDPKEKLAWGSHGWDKSNQKDTGVEVQKVLPTDWRFWDKYSMKLKACWRHQDFTQSPVSQKVVPTELGQYPETHSQQLSGADLGEKTRYTLWIMRNEMFARYGYRFKNRELDAHFQRQFWYQPTHLDSDAIFYHQFSEIERSNLKLIYQYEQDRIAGKIKPVKKPPENLITLDPSPEDDYDYPETATRRLTRADLAGKSKRELRIMRNEIFARYGYRFGKSDLRTHFERKSWYDPTTTDAAYLYNHRFTQIERDNVTFIRKFEQD